MKTPLMLLMAALLLAACAGAGSDPDTAARNKAVAFAEAYLNYDFQEARRHVTPESERWLRYAASNVAQADVDLINAQEMPAAVEAVDAVWLSDSVTEVSVAASNYVWKDSIGSEGRLCPEGQFHITVVGREGRLFVRMAGPLRSERQSHD